MEGKIREGWELLIEVGLKRRRKSNGSKKWVSWVSKITETPISNGNFSLEITYKLSKKGYFLQKIFWSQKQTTETEKVFF